MALQRSDRPRPFSRGNLGELNVPGLARARLFRWGWWWWHGLRFLWRVPLSSARSELAPIVGLLLFWKHRASLHPEDSGFFLEGTGDLIIHDAIGWGFCDAGAGDPLGVDLLWVYWLVAAFGRKKTKRSESRFGRLSYTLPLFAVVVLAGAARVFSGDGSGNRFVPPGGATEWIGAAVTVAGVCWRSGRGGISAATGAGWLR